MIYLGVALVLGATLVGLWRIADEMKRQRHDAAIQQLLATFAPAAAAVQQDPRQLLVWYPLAQASRKLFPAAFSALDQAAGLQHHLDPKLPAEARKAAQSLDALPAGLPHFHFLYPPSLRSSARLARAGAPVLNLGEDLR